MTQEPIVLPPHVAGLLIEQLAARVAELQGYETSYTNLRNVHERMMVDFETLHGEKEELNAALKAHKKRLDAATEANKGLSVANQSLNERVMELERAEDPVNWGELVRAVDAARGNKETDPWNAPHLLVSQAAGLLQTLAQERKEHVKGLQHYEDAPWIALRKAVMKMNGDLNYTGTMNRAELVRDAAVLMDKWGDDLKEANAKLANRDFDISELREYNAVDWHHLRNVLGELNGPGHDGSDPTAFFNMMSYRSLVEEAIGQLRNLKKDLDAEVAMRGDGEEDTADEAPSVPFVSMFTEPPFKDGEIKTERVQQDGTEQYLVTHLHTRLYAMDPLLDEAIRRLRASVDVHNANSK